MSEITEILQAQKNLGDSLKRKAERFDQLAQERKTYEYVKESERVAKELMELFMNNDGKLRDAPELERSHEYFSLQYYMNVEKICQQYLTKLGNTIRDLEAANPELKRQDDPKTGKTQQQGIPLNLENLFKAAGESGFHHSGNNSFALESSTKRAFVSVMKRITDQIAALRAAEANNDPEEGLIIQRKGILHNANLLKTMQEELIAGPNYDIEPYLEIVGLVNAIEMQIPQNSKNPGMVDSTRVYAKLPKLSVPTFAGECVKYQSFKELFMRMIGNKEDLDGCEKLAYLRGQLKDEPLRMINTLPIETTSYNTAWTILDTRYSNKHLIMSDLMNKLLFGPAMEKYDISSIRKVTDYIREIVGTMINLGYKMDPFSNVTYYYIIAQKLDSVTKTHYENQLDIAGDARTYDNLMKFLENRIQTLTVSKPDYKGEASKAKKVVRFQEYKKEEANSRKTSSFVVSKNITSPNQCDCAKPHTITHCPVFLALDAKGKMEKARQWKMCFNCLSKEHTRMECRSKVTCGKCNRKHLTIMHFGKGGSGSKVSLLGSGVSSMGPECVFLATAIVHVIGTNGKPIQARVLLDSGSQINIMTQRLFNKTKASYHKTSMAISGIGVTQVKASKRASIVIKSKASGFKVDLEAFVLKEITYDQPANFVDTTGWKIPNNINLADPSFNTPAAVDLIIGGEIFFKLLSIGLINIGKNLPDLQNTVFGWVVTGKVLGLQQNEAFTGVVTASSLDQQVAKFWQMEDRYQEDIAMTQRDMDCEEYFDRTTMRDMATGKFIVNLQFVQEPSVLGDSKKMAIRRFLYLERKFQKDPELKQEYAQFMDEYEQLGHMKMVKQEDICEDAYFIPHHAVRNPSSSTTKLRVVFDASAKTTSGISLNEILAKGPVLQEDLFSILVRFRTHLIVFSADITKMYRQVEVNESHQRFQMIVWRSQPDLPLMFYKLKTVTYGTTCASYLAIKALRTLAEEYKGVYPEASIVARRDFNVDDVMTGANNLDEALKIQQQLIDMCKQGNFHLHKWCSNHPTLLEMIPKNKQEVSLDINAEKTETKALGMKWIPKGDMFVVSYAPIEHSRITKRTVLSEMAQLFDPLGLVNPIIVLAKIFMQELCNLKLHWDAALPMELHSKWIQFRQQLRSLNGIQQPRRVIIENAVDIQLHVFSDSCEKAYGGVAYVRSENSQGEVIVRLLCSKSRVAPIKSISLPRLELCGALLAVVLSEKLQKVLGLGLSSTTYWTDSEIVLSWILSEGSYKTFVANRVAAIKRKTSNNNWKYINTKCNPADLVSRGMTPEKLMKSNLWREGPAFLKEKQDKWPQIKAQFVREISEEKTIKTVLAAVSSEPHFIDKINHRNSLRMLQRVVAYVVRVVPKKESEECNPKTVMLSVDELRNAMTLILKHVQMTCFANEVDNARKGKSTRSKFNNFSPVIDANGILRVGGRLRKANMTFEQRHPVLLPKGHFVTRLVLEQTHRDNMHAGPQALLHIVRQTYWPENGKRLAQEVVRNCVLCAKSKPKMLDQIMGDLPENRVTIARAFHNVSVDFAGPVAIYSTLRGKRSTKGYICIFVCFTTKAVHMEAAVDLSINGFIGCLKRFIARRGLPKSITSDNATNLRGVHNQLTELADMLTEQHNQESIHRYCQDHEIEWKFCPPRSPHFNGLAEAAVKSAKWHLRKILHSARLTYDELGTMLAEIEAILNSRPLTPMSQNPDDLQPLTAGHFLIGAPLNSIEDKAITEGPRTKIWFKLVQMKNEFWHRWSTEYLNELQSKVKWRSERDNIKIGTLVVIKEDNTAPLKWRMGIVTQTFSDEGGRVRVVELRTSVIKIPDVPDGNKRIRDMSNSTKLVRRAIHRICPLPIEVEDSEVDKPIQPKETQIAEGPSSSIEQFDNKNNETANDINSGDEAEDENQPVAKRTRSKQQLSLCSILNIALIFFALISTSVGTQCSYKSFDTNPGIYFENVGKMALSHDNWNIVCVLRLDQLWQERAALETLLDRLDNVCIGTPTQRYCDITRKQLRQQTESINGQSDLIYGFSHNTVMRKRRGVYDCKNEDLQSENVLKRVKRGWANFIGNTLNVVAGVMDNEESEKIQSQINYLNDTYHHTMKLMADQTTIQDITRNIIKNDEVNVSKRLTKLQQEIERVENSTLENTYFDMLAIQTLAIIESYREKVSAIIDLITQIRHGHISTVLITPAQIKQNLNQIMSRIDKDLMIPGDGTRVSLVQLYGTMDAIVDISNQNIIIKLILPLISREFYDIFHTIPVPFLHDDNELYMISATTQYMAVNKRQDKYYLVTNSEKDACKTLSNEIILCTQTHMLYSVYNNSAGCEMAIFTHSSKTIPPKCMLEKVNSGQVWSRLHYTNQFIFTVPDETKFGIICSANTTVCKAKGSGIIQLEPQCILQTENFEINAENNRHSSDTEIIVPGINISDVLPDKVIIPTFDIMDNDVVDKELERLGLAIEHQRIQLDTTPTINMHDIHHYTVTYLLLATMIVGCGFLCWWILKIRKAIPIRKPTPVPQPRNSKKFENLDVSFRA